MYIVEELSTDDIEEGGIKYRTVKIYLNHENTQKFASGQKNAY
ncbi:hypothetical protein SM124_13355 [Bacillus sp. 31A1R]|uniref:Uncharacterized protein n=1 Tax=Robertmurraya mangrovi TaxID=3098077 RepID=A0ABU5IZX1_9BACI|nr:hypothetical protein [Bacillus sp. 31A1R]MDZ5472715.1 hypothetical protein [Bacillus sp. 31A1R]